MYFKIFNINPYGIPLYRTSHPEVFLEKGVLKICSKFTGEHLWMSASVYDYHN